MTNLPTENQENMFLKTRDYSKSIIYKICCNDTDIKDVYVGSTTNLYNRKALHKSDFLNVSSPRYNKQLYQCIRSNGDWANWCMIMIEEFSCENKRQLEQRERFWIEEIKPSLNKHLPFVTPEELKEKKIKYYQDNKETILTKLREEYSKDNSLKKKYYQEHKEQILKNQKEKYEKKKSMKNMDEIKQ